ncbi:MAG: transglycosylase SLT domain-containing protein [Calditrichia bacterium]
MDFAKFRSHFSISYLIFAIVVVDFIFCHQQVYNSEGDSYYEATRSYEVGQYAQALTFFEQALKEDSTFTSRYPQIQFKIAYCLYKTEQYQPSLDAFRSEKTRITEIEDYADFFALRSILALGDTVTAIKGLERFRRVYPKTTLGGPLDSLLASIHYAREEYSKSAAYYKKMLKYRRFDKGDTYGHLLRISKKLNWQKSVDAYAIKLMRSYPFHSETPYAFTVYADKYSKRLIPQSNLRRVFTYLTKTDQFRKAGVILDRQEKLGGRGELTRWLRIKLSYEQKNYWVAFQECRDQRSSFKNLRFLRDIDLHIARCYLRLGSTNKAIQAYDTFQKRYPNDGLSAEVLWVIAWMYEGQDNVLEATRYYKKLLKQYPRSEFVDESRFRIGLSHYRQQNYSEARAVWSRALKQRPYTREPERYQYWLSKAFEKEAVDSSRNEILVELAKRPFESYYNMKAFLLTAEENNVNHFVDSLLWEMHHKRTSYLPKYLDNFQRPLIVQDILGENYSQTELNTLSQSLNKSKWELLYALGEINERLQNYGKAYRSYRRVFNENFARRDWKDWTFLLKNLYPFYFDGEVNKYAKKWQITPASIWAVMKKESAFEPQIISYADAYGLMQIIPPTAKRLSQELGLQLDDVRQLYEPNFNIKLGSYYISELLKRYQGNLYHALAAYNAGEHRVDRWRKVLKTDDNDFFMENIEFEQTRKYVRGATKFYWTYYLMIYPNRTPQDLLGYPERISLKANPFDLKIRN